MKRAVIASLAVALLAGSTAASNAAPLSPAMTAGVQSHAVDATKVQWRGYHHHRRWHGGHWRHRHYGGYGWGPAIGGLAAGAIIGSAIANSNAAAGNSVSYCMNRFKSYDPASGTYLGYDGNRHPCP